MFQNNVIHTRCRWTSWAGVQFVDKDYEQFPASSGYTDVRYAYIDLNKYKMDLVVEPGKTISEIAKDAELAINGPFAYDGYPLGHIVKGEILTQKTQSADAWADFIMLENGDCSIGQIDPDHVEGIKLAFSSTPQIVKGGEIYIPRIAEGTPEDVTASKRPRTAIGITSENELIVCVVDGDSQWDAGLRVDELAAVMIKLGAVEALNLDGGGSSCMVENGQPISANKGTRKLGAAIVFKPKNPSKLKKIDMTSPMHMTNPSMDPKGLTVHTTANRDKGADAIMHDRYYDNNSDRVSVHWTVDNKKAVLSVPENRAAWHAGNRSYNLSYIGMEICENNVRFIDGVPVLDAATYRNAVLLAADILRRHNWTVDNMIQHREVPGREWKNCPNRDLIDWGKFKTDVQRELGEGKGEETLYRVQVGAFSEKANAERLAKDLEAKGYNTIIRSE